MKNAKLVSTIVGISLLSSAGLSYAAANESIDSASVTVQSESQTPKGKKMERNDKVHKGGMKMQLTEEERAQLESMDSEQKKGFFETKKEELKAQKEAREIIIDKLLAGETLSAEEDELRQEMIKERAEMKQIHAQMETIKQKIDNDESLTEEEETFLQEKGPKGPHKGGNIKGPKGPHKGEGANGPRGDRVEK